MSFRRPWLKLTYRNSNELSQSMYGPVHTTRREYIRVRNNQQEAIQSIDHEPRETTKENRAKENNSIDAISYNACSIQQYSTVQKTRQTRAEKSLPGIERGPVHHVSRASRLSQECPRRGGPATSRRPAGPRNPTCARRQPLSARARSRRDRPRHRQSSHSRRGRRP